ncbi:MAG: TetR/AcrR family transcriptional regulator [Acidimicrobiia bacterium]
MADTAPPRLSREERREQTRDRLLEAARAVFAERGFYGASVEEITGRAGYTRGAFYSNFESKAEVFLALLDTHIEREAAALEAAMSADPSTTTLVEVLSGGAGRQRGRRRQSRDWTLLWAEFWLHVMRHPELAPKLAARQQAVRSALARLIERHCDSLGVSVPIPADQLAAVMLAVDDGLRLQENLDPKAVPPDLRARMLRVLFGGLAAGATQPPSAET